MKYIRFSLLIHILLVSLSIVGQPKCYFEHYGVEDGLPQSSIMDMLQDKKDFLWFSTWAGLCKFDGYNFYTYQIQQGDKYVVRSNRIDVIKEDKYGNIWALPYDREPLRFDPRIEQFVGLRHFDEYKNFTFIANDIITTRSGKVWLLSENMGCVCVVDSTFNVLVYNEGNNKIYGKKVFSIYEDEKYNSWILTNNGLYQVSADGTKICNFFSEKENLIKKPMQSFYSAMELNNQLWFGSDNGRIWVYDNKDEQFTLLETHATSKIHSIKNIDNNKILIASQKDGFYIYDISTKKIEKYTTANFPTMRSDEIVSCYIDRSKNIWLELNCLGVSKFDMKTRSIKHFEMAIESKILNVFPPNFYIIEDNENRLWVHPRGGGFALYNSQEDKLEPFYNELSSSNWRFSNVVQKAYSDKQGNLWMSTRSHGLEKIIFNNDVFNSKIVDKNVNSTINNDIRALFEDSNRNLWVATKGEKIFVYDSAQKQIGHLCQTGKIGSETPIKGICYCIIEDDKKNIWIGTKGEGIYKLSPTNGFTQYKVTQYKNSLNDLYSLSDNNVYSIFQDHKKRIWVGTYGGGLNLLDEKQGERFINYKNNLKNYPSQYGSQVRIVSSDKYGNICVGTTLGLIMFSSDFETVNSIEYKSFIKAQGDDKSLAYNDVYDICTTQKGETYVATFGGGINKIVAVDAKGFPVQFASYTINDGLPSNLILTIVEDHNEKLWIGTEGNLAKFDPAKNSFETYSEVNRLIENHTFSENARCTSKSGTVYFGFSKGLISIDPNKLNTNTFNPYVALTKLQIANNDVVIGKDSPLTKNIDDIESITLDHTQNFISIEFVALDYIEPKRINYSYKLDGFDKDWVVTNKQRIASYTNLSPGEYTFRVKSTNSDGIWMDNEHTLKIEITPSFWQTGWAYLLYVILVLMVICIIMSVLFWFYRLENKIKMEHDQTEMKTRFFIDISHEIRTPLTMIVSPVENIIESENTPSDIKTQLNLVLKHTNRMLRMVNQILDFRKIQKQNLNIQDTVVGVFVQEISNNFSKTAEEKGIDLIVNNQIGDEKLWMDRDSFEKLLYNLLSNAFKFSPSGKIIEISLTHEKRDNVIALMVRDEGKGMTKDIQNKLFTRFASFNKDKNKPSTGIGLSIVKEVADKHHAKIAVESEPDKGTTFTVYFQKGLDHFKMEENVNLSSAEEVKPVPMHDENIAKTEFEIASQNETNNHKETILVVEDDSDLRSFILSILCPQYNVLEAPDGKVGYNLAIQFIPDFIISDIMMPEIDGAEFLKKIRGNTDTSHIPFILLTAKTNIESKLEGLDYGADDYITKPFSVRYLRSRIENIIRQRKLLHQYFSNYNFTPIGNGKDTAPYIKFEIAEQDELFIQKVKAEIERNIDDREFLVDDLVASMAMSRTVFFKKMKSLTGFAPVEFIREIKIRYAAKIIDTQQYSIKEVAYMIGISDAKYFTRCFKAIFGMTPSEYKNRKQT